MNEGKELFGSLLSEVRGIIADDMRAGEAKLQAVCELLRDAVERYDWVGFYVVDSRKSAELVLGPFAGEPTEHIRIPFGVGLCGLAAVWGRPVLVGDVSKQSNYLACSPKVRSEIVLPIIRDGEVIGELDIDSHTPEAFGEADESFLQAVCELVADVL